MTSNVRRPVRRIECRDRVFEDVDNAPLSWSGDVETVEWRIS